MQPLKAFSYRRGFFVRKASRLPAGFLNRVFGSARLGKARHGTGPHGKKKEAGYSALFETRFRLYQSRFLQVTGYVAAFLTFYNFIPMAFQIFEAFFRIFAPFLENSVDLSNFTRRSRFFANFVSKFAELCRLFATFKRMALCSELFYLVVHSARVFHCFL